MIYTGAAILVLLFLFILKLLNVPEKASLALVSSQKSIAIIRDPEIDDEAKEIALQNYAKELFGIFFHLSLGVVAALLLPAGLIWLLDQIGVMPMDEVFSFTLSWEFILLITVGTVVIFTLPRKHTDSQAYEIRYSFMDKALHYLAFNTVIPQLTLADLEDTFFKKQLATVTNERPVFITGLPRGGTTLLLEMCFNLNEFASHQYRNMPFLFVPMSWNRFSSHFQKNDEKRERAHGDGMLVSVDSPEALEEMLWKPFWKKQYAKDKIQPWSAQPYGMFDEFFANHMKKIVALKQDMTGIPCRYLSKNNLNICRIDYIRETIPDATIIIPFRSPLMHAQSLLKQHQNFLGIHKRDHFASVYMKAIGHYDFGDNIRPIDFDGWLSKRKYHDFEDINFCLEYWIATYSNLLTKIGGNVYLHSHEALCNDPYTALTKLAEAIDINDQEAFMKNEKIVWQRPASKIDKNIFDPELLKQAEDLYKRLRANSLT